MEYVNLGKTGLKVSKICLGCMGFGELERGGIPGKTNEEEVDTDTLMRATTMAKNGVHRAALEEKAKRVEAIREELSNLAQNKKDVLSKELMEEHFNDTDDITKTAAESVIYKNP